MDKTRLNELCKKKNVTISEVEKSLNLSNGSLRKDGDIKSERVLALADYFDVPMEYLMGRDPKVDIHMSVPVEYVAEPTLDRVPNKKEMVLLYLMTLLNEDGFDEAIKRVEELTQLNKYKKEGD